MTLQIKSRLDTEKSEEIGGEGKIRVNVRRANSQTHQRIRPLTDLIGAPEKPGGNVLFPETGNTIWTPLPNLPGGKTVGIPEIKKSVKNHSATIIGGRKSLPTTTSPKFVREILRPKETTAPLQRVAPPSESSRVVYFPDKETPLEEKLVSQGINSRVRLGRVRGLISKSARDFNQKKKKKKERGQPSTFFGKSPPSSEYDSFLDSLQAPRVLGEPPPPRPRSPATPRKSKPVPKQDRKSNLDFLGIFDTRQYFYIPNRRSDEAKTQKNSGVLAKIVNLFMGH